MKQWDKIYKQFKNYGGPLTHVEGLVELFKKRNIRKILDLGCGSGRHLIYLAKYDFEAYGIDIAKEGIRIAEENLKKESLKADLRIGSIYNLPYEDNFFDAIISIRVLNHGKITQIRKSIKEIERVLKPNGLIFITVQRIITKKKSKIRLINSLKVKMIDSKTYFPLEGPEKQVVHRIFNKKSLLKEFKNFEIHKFWVDYGKEKWQRYYCLLGELK